VEQRPVEHQHQTNRQDERADEVALEAAEAEEIDGEPERQRRGDARERAEAVGGERREPGLGQERHRRRDDEGGHGEEVPVHEVHDPHHAEDQREPEREQDVDGADLECRHAELDKGLHR
jgi:hypothetical protein